MRSACEKLGVKWLGINSLMVFDRSVEQTTIHGETDATRLVRELHWNTDTQSCISRKLYNETHDIFMNLQEACKEEKPTLETLLSISLKYRAVIHSCITKINEKLRFEKDLAISEGMRTQLDLFNIVALLWHLCEVLFIESQPGGFCMRPLLSWVKLHFKDVNDRVNSLMSSEDLYFHPDYWNTIKGLVLQGRLEEVCDLLKHHPQRDNGRFDAFASIEELMKKMPMILENEGQSMNDFLSKWEQWNRECNSRLSDGDFSQQREVEEICQLLCGRDSAFVNHSDLCQSWCEMMVAKLLYTQPTVTTFNLKRSAVECLELFNGVGNVSRLDEIILSAISFDLHAVIESCSEMFSNWWFVGHLADLMYHCSLLKSYNLDYGAELREFLLLEYGRSLMSHTSLWCTAADYLMCCPTYGREHLIAYVEKIPLECEKKALKLIHLCNKHNLVEQALSICRVMGMKALRRKRLGVALSWCLRSKDEAFASLLTDQFLNHYMDAGTFIQCDLIDNLGSSMLLNNKLTFLGKYYEFHKLYTNGSYKEAGRLLVSLLTSNIAPKKFWKILLIDSLPLLEHKELIFLSEQTFELMQCLTELQLSCFAHESDLKNKVIKDEEKERVELLRLALSRNLSRALLAV